MFPRPAFLCALAVGAAAIALPTPAAGSSLSYLDGGNVWLTSPDGASNVQVTPDGTLEDPYRYQAQSVAGPIVATRGSSSSSMLSRYAGPTLVLEHINVLPRKSSGGLQVYPISLSVNPTGEIASYGHSSCNFMCQSVSLGTWLALTRGGTDPTNPTEFWYRNTRFLGDRLIGSDGSTISIQKDVPEAPFTPEWEGWLQSADLRLLQATASMEARQFAVVYEGDTQGDEGVMIGGHDGNIPGGALGPFCVLPTQSDAFHPTFSPDGTLVAWVDAGGVKVAGIPDLAAGTESCSLTGPARVLSPTGKMPSFGGSDAAAVAAARGPAPSSAAAPPPAVPPAGPAPSGSVPGGPAPDIASPGTSAPGASVPAPKLTVRVARSTTRAKLRKGLPVRVVARAKGRVTVTATVPRSVARRLGLRSRAARVVVAKGAVTASRKGSVTVRVRPVKAAVRAVARMRNVTLRLRATQAKAVGQATVRVR